MSQNRAHIQVLKLLLDHPKTELGPVDSKGQTPLWGAMEALDSRTVSILRSRGAPVQPDTAVPLCKAAAINNVKLFSLLLEHNIDVLAKVGMLAHGCVSL